MKKKVIILIIILALAAVIFSKGIFTFIWESKVNYDQAKQDKALDEWGSAEEFEVSEEGESQRFKQMCESTLFTEDCSEPQPELRENCLKCEQAGLKRVSEKPVDNSIKTDRQTSSEEEKSRAPIIKNLGVSFGDYDSLTKKAGDFSFMMTPKRSTTKIIGEFGEVVNNAGGGTKKLPHYTYYYLPQNISVTAVADGEVIAVWYQEETKDYAVLIKPVYDSYWSTGYDHVLNPAVKENQTVKSGDVIAYTGDFLEISLESEKQDPGVFYPLLPYFDSAIKAEYEQKVWKLMSDWEAYKGDNSIYDESRMSECAGCLDASILDVGYN